MLATVSTRSVTFPVAAAPWRRTMLPPRARAAPASRPCAWARLADVLARGDLEA
jgi:hypothetical protein